MVPSLGVRAVGTDRWTWSAHHEPALDEDGLARHEVGVGAAEGADLLGHLLGTFGVNVVDGDVGPVGGQPERDGPADSPRLPLAAPATTASFLSMLLMGTYLLVGASSGW
jgi:hypothetical protein